MKKGNTCKQTAEIKFLRHANGQHLKKFKHNADSKAEQNMFSNKQQHSKKKEGSSGWSMYTEWTIRNQ